MRIVVNDANIMIDLAELGLVEEFFRLPFEFHVTSPVFNEIDLQQRIKFDLHVSRGALRIHHPSQTQLIEINNIIKKYKSLSPEDGSAFIHAQEMTGILVSGDKRLRKCAESMGVEYHGHLWVLDELFENEILSGKVAIEKLNKLLEYNKRLGLPHSECIARKQIWSSGNE